MELGTLLFLLVILACPLMMVWMMRGHGGHGHTHRTGNMHAAGGEAPGRGSLDELRERWAELDAEIAQLEQADSKTPAAV